MNGQRNIHDNIHETFFIVPHLQQQKCIEEEEVYCLVSIVSNTCRTAKATATAATGTKFRLTQSSPERRQPRS